MRMNLKLGCVLLFIAVCLVSIIVYNTLDEQIDQETMTNKERMEITVFILIIGVPLIALFLFGTTLRG